MSPFDRDYELGKEYRNRKQHQAFKHRQIVDAQASNPTRRLRLAHVYKPTLFKLGKRLESIGTTLQVRYGDLKPSPSNR